VSGLNFWLLDSVQGFLNHWLSLEVDSYVVVVLGRKNYWLSDGKVSQSGDVLGSASVLDFGSFGNRSFLMSLLSNVGPVNCYVFFLVVRFNEVSGDVNISVNSSGSNASVVSGLYWLVLSREGSSDISSRLDLNFLSVVHDSRFDEGSVVDLVSGNVDASFYFSVFGFGRFDYWVSLDESVGLFDEDWVEFLGGYVHVRLNDDLLSGWLNEVVGDVSGWSDDSFGDNLRLLHHSVDDGLGFRVYSFDWTV